MSQGGEGFYESFLIVSYIIITTIIVSNMLLAVFIDVWSSSSHAQRHEELLQQMQSSAAATASVLAVLEAKSSSASSGDYARSKIEVMSTPLLKGRRGSTATLHSPVVYDKSPQPMQLPPQMQLQSPNKKMSSSVRLIPEAATTNDDAGVVLRRIGPWREMQGSDGDVYYWNKFTGVVTWTHPKQLTQETQNPAVTSVAAALYKLNAKDLKSGDEGHGRHDVEDMFAAANLMRPVYNSVRTQAELANLHTTEEHDNSDYGGGVSAMHGHELTTEGKSSAPSSAIAGQKEGKIAAKTEQPDVKKKMSAIQMWCVCAVANGS